MRAHLEVTTVLNRYHNTLINIAYIECVVAPC